MTSAFIFIAGFVCGQLSLFIAMAFFMGAGGDQ